MELLIFMTLGLLLLTVMGALVALVVVIMDFVKENKRYKRRLR